MNRKVKIIIITSLVTLVIGGSAFYLLFWRKRKGVSEQDADMLKAYQIEEQPVPAEALQVVMSLPIF